MVKTEQIQSTLDFARNLTDHRPSGFNSRSEAARTLTNIREAHPEITPEHIKYIEDLCTVFKSTTIRSLARRNQLTLFLVKPNAAESKGRKYSMDRETADQQAANMLSYQLEREVIKNGKSLGRGKILLSFPLQFTPDQVERWYKGLREKVGEDVWANIVNHMAGGPLTAILAQHEVKNANGLYVVANDAVNWGRERIGATNPLHASPGTVRRQYALAMSNNLVHGSDSVQSVERETNLLGDFIAENKPGFLSFNPRYIAKLANTQDGIDLVQSGQIDEITLTSKYLFRSPQAA